MMMMMMMITMMSRGSVLLFSILSLHHVEGFSILSTTASSAIITTTTTSAATTSFRTALHATVARTDDVEAPECGFVKNAVVDAWNAESANEYADMFGFAKSEAGFYGLVQAMRTAQIAMGLRGVPFVLRRNEIEAIVGDNDLLFKGFFTMKDLEKALEDDFLDAARGSTDNRKGWKVRWLYIIYDVE